MKKKFKEDVPNTLVLDMEKNASTLFQSIRLGKFKEVWEKLEAAGLNVIENVSQFFLSIAKAIKEFLIGGEPQQQMGTAGKPMIKKSGIIPQSIQNVLKDLYNFIIRAVHSALSFIQGIYQKVTSGLTKQVILPGGQQVKVYTIMALAVIGALITIGVYKLVQVVQEKKAEENPAAMEETVIAAREAFTKSSYLFDGILKLNEDDGFAEDKVAALVEKASYVSNDVINFADPDVAAEEDESKLVAFFKKFGPFVALVAVATALVLVGKKVFPKVFPVKFAGAPAPDPSSFGVLPDAGTGAL